MYSFFFISMFFCLVSYPCGSAVVCIRRGSSCELRTRCFVNRDGPVDACCAPVVFVVFLFLFLLGVPVLLLAEIPFMMAKFAVFDAFSKVAYNAYPLATESVAASLAISLVSGMVGESSGQLTVHTGSPVSVYWRGGCICVRHTFTPNFVCCCYYCY